MVLFACQTEKKKQNKAIEETQEVVGSKSQTLIKKCIAAHGGDLYDSAQYEFQFSELVNRFLIKKASTVMY